MITEKRNNYLSQGMILAVAGLVTRFIGLMYRVPLNRIVGKEGMGYYATAYEVYNLCLLISTYSIPIAISKIISAFNAKGEYESAKKTFKIGLIFSGSVGAVVSVLLEIFALPVATMMGYPTAALPLRVLAPTIFIFSCMGVLRGFFQGHKNMLPTAISQVIEQIVNAVVSVVCAVWFISVAAEGFEPAYGAAGGTAGTLAGAAAGLVFLVCFILFKKKDYNSVEENSGLAHSSRKLLGLLMSTMIPIILSQTIYQLSGITDNFMFGRILDLKGFDEPARAVIYDAYSNKYKWLYNLPVAIASAFSVSVIPTLSSAFANKDSEGIKSKIRGTIKINMIVAIPAAAGLAFLADPIMILIFGDNVGDLPGKLMIFGSVAVIFFANSTLTNGILQGVNRLKAPVIHSGISLLIHIAILFIMLYFLEWGIWGLLIANIIYAVVVCILNYRKLYTAVGYKQEIKFTFIIPLICSLLMGAAGRGCHELFLLMGLKESISTIVSICICVIIYFILIILLKGLTSRELKALPKGNAIVGILKKLRLLRE